MNNGLQFDAAGHWLTASGYWVLITDYWFS
jgi:hypothetical protein